MKHFDSAAERRGGGVADDVEDEVGEAAGDSMTGGAV